MALISSNGLPPACAIMISLDKTGRMDESDIKDIEPSSSLGGTTEAGKQRESLE